MVKYFRFFYLQRRHAWSIVTLPPSRRCCAATAFISASPWGRISSSTPPSPPPSPRRARRGRETACWRSAPASARSATSSAAVRAGSSRSSWTRRCCPFWTRRWRTSTTSRSSPPISSRPTFPPLCAKSSRDSRPSSARTCPITSRRLPSPRCSSQSALRASRCSCRRRSPSGSAPRRAPPPMARSRSICSTTPRRVCSSRSGASASSRSRR